jgi:hypothetical protein
LGNLSTALYYGVYRFRSSLEAAWTRLESVRGLPADCLEACLGRQPLAANANNILAGPNTLQEKGLPTCTKQAGSIKELTRGADT